MTPEEMDALPNPTASQMVRYFDYLITNGKAGTSYSIRGRQMTHPPLDALLRLRTYYADLADDESAGDRTPLGSTSLVRFIDPR